MGSDVTVLLLLLFFVLCSDSDGHVASEGEEEPELSGAVCSTAGVLSGVWYGEDKHARICLSVAVRTLVNIMSLLNPHPNHTLHNLMSDQNLYPNLNLILTRTSKLGLNLQTVLCRWDNKTKCSHCVKNGNYILNGNTGWEETRPEPVPHHTCCNYP